MMSLVKQLSAIDVSRKDKQVGGGQLRRQFGLWEGGAAAVQVPGIGKVCIANCVSKADGALKRGPHAKTS
jgi:hypothetical protein